MKKKPDCLRDKFKPYLRRGNFREKASTMRDAIRLAFWREWARENGRFYYVLIQRKCPPDVIMAVGQSKAAIKKDLVGARRGGFAKWADRVKRRAQGRKS
jgi:hypothetical protein